MTSLNGFYLSRFKTPFLNLPVLYIPCPFASETKLKLHELSAHQNDPEIFCRQCDQGGFVDKNHLKEHLNEAHKRIFACSICNIRYHS